MRRNNPHRARRRARPPRHRWRRPRPLVLPFARRVRRAPESPRIPDRDDPADPPPTPLPGDVIGWLETFAQNFIAALPEDERRPYLEEVREILRPDLCDASGSWTADYTRLRFSALKP